MPVTRISDVREDDSDAKERLNVLIFETLMESKGVPSIAELSRRTGVHKSTIFRLISGDGGRSLRVARAIARELDTTVETLFAKVGAS